MYQLEEKEITCPYCGEIITVLIDCSVSEQIYVEDCQVCCQPIVLDCKIDDESILIIPRQENE
jgi:transcription elongation factor Elf1